MNPEHNPSEIPFWSTDIAQQFQQTHSSQEGLSKEEALNRLKQYGPNQLGKANRLSSFELFLNQFKSPITLLLIGAAILSGFLNDPTDAFIILGIVLISSILGFWQEVGAGNAVSKLLSIIQLQAQVYRDKAWIEVPLAEVVPGDVVKLGAGDSVPADCLLIESEELFTDEAAFTGETFPVEKKTGVLEKDTPLAKRSNTLMMGSHITSGTGRALVIRTGLHTEFGKISSKLKSATPETEFEKGIRQLGQMLMVITGIITFAILLVNIILQRPLIDSFLFALALAVGLTPQLLPAIISINLAKGAQMMAKKSVIVKRLSSIENFGSMNVLCSDKTGTLTEGKVKVQQISDYLGNASEDIARLAIFNAQLQQGYRNPIDEAILEMASKNTGEAERLDEIPYDFIRKRLCVLARLPEGNTMIVKGAYNKILEICTQIRTGKGETQPIHAYKSALEAQYEAYSNQGYRTLAIAVRAMPGCEKISKADEAEFVFLGFITLFDPIKSDAAETIRQLNELGVNLKIITGDNVLIARHIGLQLGFGNPIVLSGKELNAMDAKELGEKAEQAHIFAEVEPSQKEQIILALKKAGNVVGYMGDGINDATALHAADVGISVNSAVDVAKEAADIVLLENDISVILDGVAEGRKVFLNTHKYVFMAVSANFGNMFSMAGASLMLPFLPLLPKQVLMTNLLTDLPEMTIATDNVDAQTAMQPLRWDIGFITRFMMVFGLLSSVFDYLTFGVLVFFLEAGEKEFQTGWFMESVISASMIVLVLRTHLSIFKSRPGKYLFAGTMLTGLFTLLIPFMPFADLLGFTSLPWHFYLVLLGIVFFYVLSAELIKIWFYRPRRQATKSNP